MKHDWTMHYNKCIKCNTDYWEYHAFLNSNVLNMGYGGAYNLAMGFYPCISDEEFIIKKALE